MIARLLALAALCGAAFATAPAADPALAVTREFKVVATSDIKMEAGDVSAAIIADTVYRYTWARVGRERTMSLRELSVKMKAGDQERMNVTISRAGMSGIENGQKFDQKYDDAPEKLREMLRDTFDAPVCTLEVDADGREVKRTVSVKPGARQALDAGMIANTTLFHPRYAADKDEWTADGAVSAGQGEAAGKLTYTKINGDKAGQAVKVAGTLKADGLTVKGGTIKEGKYTVTGTQTYDPKIQEWIAGELNIDLSLIVDPGNKQLATGKGKMKLTFEMLPEKK